MPDTRPFNSLRSMALLGLGFGLALAASTQAEPDRRDQSSHRDRDHSSYRSQDDFRRAAPRSVRYPALGHNINRLPDRHQLVRLHNKRYYYHQGVFYQPRSSGAFVVVRAPLGGRVGHLPPGYVSFYIGSRRYYYANFTYYLWDRQAREYVIVEEPAGAERQIAASSSESGELFIYPKNGQTDEQRDFDRYECYLWAVEQTGYDPGAESREPSQAGDYRRAISACLEGRGYTVK